MKKEMGKQFLFKDLGIGDIFYGSGHNPEKFVKIGTIDKNVKTYEISECFPNALSLKTMHYTVFMPNCKVILFKYRKDPAYTEPLEDFNAREWDKLAEAKKEFYMKHGVNRDNYRVGKLLRDY